MKKIILLIITSTLFYSCSVINDDNISSFNFLPSESEVILNINDLNNLIIIKTYNFCFKMSPMNYLFLVIFHRFQYTL